MSGTELSIISRDHITTVPLAMKALAAMERQLSSANTFTAIRKIIDAAEAIKLLGRDVDVVKQEAEDVILAACARIGEELEKVPKATHRAGPKKQITTHGKSLGREDAMPSGTTRARYTKLAKAKPKLKAIAKKLRAEGKDATPSAVVREITQGSKKQARASKEKALGAKIAALPDRRYGVIYADPPWKFAPYSEETGMDRAADNHYPTMDTEAVMALEVPADDDCVLFLWATVPMLPHAIAVMSAWDFTYKSNFVWVKDKAGTGFWSRNKHELLLIGTRGSVPAPAHGDQYPSAIEAPRGEHSAKPFAFREMIEELFPTLPKLEMFAREQFEGWDAWGNEAKTAEAAE
jgi:N6-adenosine-specific RNA methylase IME4